jgi:uncharacterized protein (TIGR00255 family)
MTGFGQAEGSTPSGNYRVEIRGVNNRFLDIQMRLPRSFAALEAKLKKLLTDTVSRGSITFVINWDRESSEGALTWDRDKVAQYVRIFNEIRDAHNLAGEASLSHLVGFSDFIKTETVSHEDAALWRHVKPLCETAIADYQASREREGVYLRRDLEKMLKTLTADLKKIEKRAPARLKRYAGDLRQRIRQINEGAIDEQRLAIEIALMADKLDIAEECARLHAHIGKFADTFESGKPMGKRMGFILQEMNREANTIGAKANDTDIAHLSVALKEAVEKMREQIQNIE